MRNVLLGCLFMVVLTAVPLKAEIRNLDPVDNPLGDCMGATTADQCWSTYSTSTLCSDVYGCPLCMLDLSNRASCSRLEGAPGFCSCKATGTTRDEYGNPRPVCDAKGSCHVAR